MSGVSGQAVPATALVEPRRSWAGLVADLRWGALAVVSGALSGAVWRWVFSSRSSEEWGVEGFVAVGGTLAVVLAVLGLAWAVAFLVRPGAVPARRLLVLLVAVSLGGLAAWGVGRSLGMPVLDVPAVLALAPLTLAGASGLVAIVHTIRHG
ncbi:MAG: hypothetical protein U0Q15_13175 [Kineosporiaceae bacterium]